MWSTRRADFVNGFVSQAPSRARSQYSGHHGHVSANDRSAADSELEQAGIVLIVIEHNALPLHYKLFRSGHSAFKQAACRSHEWTPISPGNRLRLGYVPVTATTHKASTASVLRAIVGSSGLQRTEVRGDCNIRPVTLRISCRRPPEIGRSAGTRRRPDCTG